MTDREKEPVSSASAVEFDNPIITGPIWKQLLYFFFPILLGTFFQQLYNTADAIIVGNFVGKEALAAVGGSTNVLISFLVNLFVGISSGATVIVAQHYGAQNYEGVQKSVHTSIALSITAGIVIMVLGITLARPALVAMGTPADTLEYSILYMRIYFLGTIASFIYNIGSGILRAVGDTRRPLYFLIAACICNIILDLVFVLLLDMGVAGVGYATILSQFVAAILVLLALTNTSAPHHLDLRNIRFFPDILRSILKIGVPAGIQADMYTIANILIMSCINSFGTNAAAAWTAQGKVDGFFWMISGAYGIAITTFVGQNFGAKRYDRVKRSIWVCTGMMGATTIVISALFCTFSNPLLRMFTSDPDVIAMGTRIMLLMAPYYFTFVLIEVLSGAIRGTGVSFVPMLITCGGVCVLRILWIVFVLPFNPVFDMVMVSYPISWAITSVLYLIYYRFGKWEQKAIALQKQ